MAFPRGSTVQQLIRHAAVSAPTTRRLRHVVPEPTAIPLTIPPTIPLTIPRERRRRILKCTRHGADN